MMNVELAAPVDDRQRRGGWGKDGIEVEIEIDKR